MNREHEPLLDAWRINDRVTTFLVEQIPAALWGAALPGSPRRTVRNIATHLHNSRCSWLKSLSVGTGISIPPRVDSNKATGSAQRLPREVVGGLWQWSSRLKEIRPKTTPGA